MKNLKIECEEKFPRLKKIAKAVYLTLGQESPLKAELVFVGEEEIRRLNLETRNVDKVTDVLSYPTLDGIKNKVLYLEDYPFDVENKRLIIGSIAICKKRAREQAEEYGHSEEREITYLIVHGLMHLFGYDHMVEDEKKEMREREKAVMKILKIKEAL